MRLKKGLLIGFPVSTLLGDLRGLTPIFYKQIHPVSVTTPATFVFLPCDHCGSSSYVVNKIIYYIKCIFLFKSIQKHNDNGLPPARERGYWAR